jgi:hypothetical protein
MKYSFNDAKIKIRRAKRLLIELTSEVDAYVSSNPLTIESKPVTIDGQTGIYQSFLLRGPNEEIAAILGDIIHNLRTALDLSSGELVRSNHGNDNNVYFPFCDTEEDLENRIKQKNFNRAGEKAIALIYSLKPFKGGNTALRAIHDLDVQDKHKALLLTTILMAGPTVSLWNDDGAREISIVGDPTAPSEFKICFPQSCALAGKEIIPTLHELVQHVDGVVDAFIAVANS